MQTTILVALLIVLAASQLQVISEALHDSMGPKFALTYEEFEGDPCGFFRQVARTDPSIECTVGEEYEDEFGKMIKLTQSIAGIPIECADIRLNINKAGHTTINGEYFIKPPELNELLLEAEAAQARSKEVFSSGEHRVIGIEYIDGKIQYDEPELVIACPRPIHTGTLRLGYRTRVEHSESRKSGHIFIDAESGAHLKTHSRTYEVPGTTQTGYYGSKQVEVTYDSGFYYSSQTGTRDLIAGDCTNNCWVMSSADKDQFGTGGDDKLMAAYWGAERVVDLFSSEFSRDSFDGNGSKIQIIGIGDNNAYWVQSNGIGNAYFGFRNNINLSSAQIVAHQITHGIIEATANLVYQDEPGAINEAFADFFGIYCYQKIFSTSTVWEVGIESSTFTRSLSDPKLHSQPDTYKGTNWYSGTADNGGVHTNSGALNHAFYLMAVGGSGTNDNGVSYTVTGFGIDKTMRIAYRALERYFTQNSQYSDARVALSRAASDIHRLSSMEWFNTETAMYAIGIGSEPAYQTITANGSAHYLAPLSSALLFVLIQTLLFE